MYCWRKCDCSHGLTVAFKLFYLLPTRYWLHGVPGSCSFCLQIKHELHCTLIGLHHLRGAAFLPALNCCMPSSIITRTCYYHLCAVNRGPLRFPYQLCNDSNLNCSRIVLMPWLSVLLLQHGLAQYKTSSWPCISSFHRLVHAYSLHWRQALLPIQLSFHHVLVPSVTTATCPHHVSDVLLKLRPCIYKISNLHLPTLLQVTCCCRSSVIYYCIYASDMYCILLFTFLSESTPAERQLSPSFCCGLQIFTATLTCDEIEALFLSPAFLYFYSQIKVTVP